MIKDPVADWRELSDLYEQAESLEGAALRAWLDALPATARRLLPQLERMLGARGRVASEGFLEAPPSLPDLPEVLPSEWHEGSRIGPYQLLRHIGSGGMAEVWLAERVDGAFQRRVAIKLLFNHPTRAERETFVERFRRERDILASLDHPNIAKLHDAGVTPDGQPWLALEYVEGESLTTWCDRQRLGIRARVAVFRQVLQAVQHAHANLVIHRDLKPANIMVGRDGEVRLLDFGIAKMQEAEGGALVESELTRRAGRPLTLAYASPEQLLGRPLGTACDIYSLGVVLYELLCGEQPYELKGASAARLEDAILESTPRPPSLRVSTGAVADARSTSVKSLSRTLGADLDAIALKALHKEPERRYLSAEAFGADLGRWAAGLPIEARAPGKAYRLRKFIGRHRWEVAAGAAAVMSLLVVTAIAVLAGVEANRQAVRAVAAKDFLIDLFGRADVDRSRGNAVTAKEMLKAGHDNLAALAAQPRLQAEVLAGLGQVEASMGDHVQAATSLASVAEIYKRLGDGKAYALAQLNAAGSLLELGKHEDARQRLDAARAVSGLSNDDEVQAKLEGVKGSVLRETGAMEAAQESFLLGLASAERVFGKQDSRTIEVLRHLADVERRMRKYQAAMSHLDEASQRIQKNPTSHAWDRVYAEGDLVAAEASAGMMQVATDHIERFAPQCERDLGAHSESCMYLRQWQVSTLLRMGFAAKAAALLPLLEGMLTRDASPVRQTGALALTVRTLARVGQMPGHEDLLRRLQEVAGSDDQLTHPNSLQLAALMAWAEADLMAGRSAEAIARIRKAMGKRRPESDLDRNDFGRMHLLLGLAMQILGRQGEALDAFQESNADYVAALGVRHPVTLLYRMNTVPSLRALGRDAEALAVIDDASFILREAVGQESPVYRRIIEWGDDLRKGRSHSSTAADPADLIL